MQVERRELRMAKIGEAYNFIMDVHEEQAQAGGKTDDATALMATSGKSAVVLTMRRPSTSPRRRKR